MDLLLIAISVIIGLVVGAGLVFWALGWVFGAAIKDAIGRGLKW